MYEGSPSYFYPLALPHLCHFRDLSHRDEVYHLLTPRCPASRWSRTFPATVGQRRRQEGYMCSYAKGQLARLERHLKRRPL